MYWFNNQFSELTRSILFPGGGGASGGQDYSSFNPRSAPDLSARQPDTPFSGGNQGSRGPSSHGDEPVHSGRRRPHGDYNQEDDWRRYADRDRFLRDDEPNRPNQPNAPRNPRPNDPPRPNLPPILSGPLRLPPIFRPPDRPADPANPNPTGPSLGLPGLTLPRSPFRLPLGGGGNP